MDEDTTGRDVSGLWHGRYSFPALLPPNPFTATLSETAGWIGGAIEELAQEGPDKGRTIGATVQGRRDGDRVHFLKTYDRIDDDGGYDSVAYDGVLNAEGTEIAGRWTIAGDWSGEFLMARAKGVAGAVARSVAEKPDWETAASSKLGIVPLNSRVP